MQRRYWLWVGTLTVLMTVPAHARQETLFMCARPRGRQPVGHRNRRRRRRRVLRRARLSSGLEVELGSGPRDRGRPTCDLVEVLKPLDPASPVYLTLAFQGTSVQRIDILFFAPTPTSAASSSCSSSRSASHSWSGSARSWSTTRWSSASPSRRPGSSRPSWKPAPSPTSGATAGSSRNRLRPSSAALTG